MKLTNNLVIKGTVSESKKEIVEYGLTTGISWIINITTMLVIGLLFGYVLESFIFLFFFSILRSYSGGFHFSKEIHCYLTSHLIILSVLFILKVTAIEYYVPMGLVILVVASLVILKLGPVETKSKKLDNEEQKYFNQKIRHHLFVDVVIIISLVLFNMQNYAYVICLSIMVVALLVTFGYLANKRQNRHKCVLIK